MGTLIAGFATGLGAVPIYFKKTFDKTTLDIGMGLSAGVMLVASFISLILPAIESAKELYSHSLAFPAVTLGIVTGYFFIIVIHNLLPHEHLFKETDMEHKGKMSRVTLVIMAICLHNLPEGMAVGVGFGGGDMSSGMTLALAIAIQNMPEGLVVAIGLLSEGSSKNKAFLMALFSGLVEPVAAFFGLLFTKISSQALPIALSFAGGTMLFVICQEIFPELFRKGHEKYASIGVVLGMILMLGIDFYI